MYNLPTAIVLTLLSAIAGFLAGRIYEDYVYFRKTGTIFKM